MHYRYFPETLTKEWQAIRHVGAGSEGCTDDWNEFLCFFAHAESPLEAVPVPDTHALALI